MNENEIIEYIERNTFDFREFRLLNGYLGQININVIKIMIKFKNKYNLDFTFYKKVTVPSDIFDNERTITAKKSNLFVVMNRVCDLSDFWDDIYKFTEEKGNSNDN
jgi:hypothetical protein